MCSEINVNVMPSPPGRTGDCLESMALARGLDSHNCYERPTRHYHWAIEKSGVLKAALRDVWGLHDKGPGAER
jgi:hypothetical protein